MTIPTLEGCSKGDGKNLCPMVVPNLPESSNLLWGEGDLKRVEVHQ